MARSTQIKALFENYFEHDFLPHTVLNGQQQ
jgi:hypothetical protein